jgi:hypothetical protein
MDRETIINAVVEVVESKVLADIPAYIPQEEVDKIMESGRVELNHTAHAIADKILSPQQLKIV